MRPRVVLCGSYHRDTEQLRRLFRELETTGCRILSPFTLDFAAPQDSFVTVPNDTAITHHDIEAFHLRAIRDADFVLLHAPAGYVGVSSAYELGFAHALSKPVFSFEQPADEVLATRVTVVQSVFTILDQLRLMPYACRGAELKSN